MLIGLQGPSYEAVHDPRTHLELVTQDVAKLVEKMCGDRRRAGLRLEEDLKELGYVYYRLAARVLGIRDVYRSRDILMPGVCSVPLVNWRELAANPAEYRRRGYNLKLRKHRRLDQGTTWWCWILQISWEVKSPLHWIPRSTEGFRALV